MFTSHKRRMIKYTAVFTAVSVFCVIFNLVYSLYGHGVSSGHMTLMFLYPLCMGTLIYGFFSLLPRFSPCRTARNLWNAAIATLTMRSCLIGVLEIAGTNSVYTEYYLYVAIVFCGLAVILFAADSIKKTSEIKL